LRSGFDRGAQLRHRHGLQPVELAARNADLA